MWTMKCVKLHDFLLLINGDDLAWLLATNAGNLSPLPPPLIPSSLSLSFFLFWLIFFSSSHKSFAGETRPTSALKTYPGTWLKEDPVPRTGVCTSSASSGPVSLSRFHCRGGGRHTPCSQIRVTSSTN